MRIESPTPPGRFPRNVRAFDSTLAANGAWLGLVALFPMAAGLLAAAVWSEVGQVLFGLAGLTCAACADPSNGIKHGSRGSRDGRGGRGGRRSGRGHRRPTTSDESPVFGPCLQSTAPGSRG